MPNPLVLHNREPLTVRQKELARRWHPLALRSLTVFSRITALFRDKDQALELAFLGLIRAAKHFDRSRDGSFSTFAMACIRNSLRQGLRYQTRLCRNQNTVQMGTGDNLEDREQVRRAAPKPVGYYLEIRDEVRNALSRLTERQRQCLLAYIETDTLQGAGEKLGVTRERIRQVIVEIQLKLSGERHPLGGGKSHVPVRSDGPAKEAEARRDAGEGGRQAAGCSADDIGGSGCRLE